MKARLFNTLFAAFGLAVALVAGTASAMPIDKTLTVQVYQVCDNGGANCASLGPVGDQFFATETNLIWAQAGISVSFNLVGQIDSTAMSFLNEASGSGDGLADYVGASASTVNLFLLHSITNPNSFGEGYIGYGGIAIAMDAVMAFNSGAGRLDTIAHELGHNLGLCPSALASCNPSGFHANSPFDLMNDGGTRLSPTNIGDIAPGGLGYDLLPADEIALARQSALLHDVDAPEPSSIALTAVALLALGVLRRIRTA